MPSPRRSILRLLPAHNWLVSHTARLTPASDKDLKSLSEPDHFYHSSTSPAYVGRHCPPGLLRRSNSRSSAFQLLSPALHTAVKDLIRKHKLDFIFFLLATLSYFPSVLLMKLKFLSSPKVLVIWSPACLFCVYLLSIVVQLHCLLFFFLK